MRYVDPNIVKTPPLKLYKYFGNLNYVLSALENKGVFLEKPSNFNDPFDELYTPFHIGSTRYITWVTFQEIINYYLSSGDYIDNYWGQIDFKTTCDEIFSDNYDWLINLDDAVVEFIRISKFSKIPKDKVIADISAKRFSTKININDDESKICCFCESNQSIPMWAYYGRNHTGVCVEYDLSLLSDDDVIKHIHPIQYRTNRDNNDMHFYKSNQWRHENEWRLIVWDYYDSYLPFDCVSGLYFGERFDFSDNSSEKFIWHKPKTFLDKTYSTYCSVVEEVKKSEHAINLYKASADLSDYNLIFKHFYEHKGRALK